MKAIKGFAVAMFCCQISFAQDISGNGLVAVRPLSFFVESPSSDLFRAGVYAGIEGSPYLSTEWTYARIRLADNRRFDSVLIKLNLYENRTHFKDELGREKMIAIDVREIEIKDSSSKWNNAFFVSGYGENDHEFYQVLADGKKARLFKKMNVIIRETTVFNAPARKSFELQDRFNIYSTDKLYKESKNCSSLMAAFGNDSKITAFVSSNDIKCNKAKDLTKLVDYYNSY